MVTSSTMNQWMLSSSNCTDNLKTPNQIIVHSLKLYIKYFNIFVVFKTKDSMECSNSRKSISKESNSEVAISVMPFYITDWTE